MRLFTTLTLLTICFSVAGQISPLKPQTYYPRTYIDTESMYMDSTGVVVIIQNSKRKAGGSLDSTGRKGYTDATGKHFVYAIFWTRVINETATPVEFTINFSSDSIAINPNTYSKLFLPSDTMTLAKESLYNYGATGLKSFFDTSFYKPTMLQRTLNSKQDFVFYIAALCYQAGGIDRAELILKEQELFYKISIVGQLEPILIPCGHIILKK